MEKTMKSTLKHSSVASSLRKFGFKQSLKGALVVGILAGIMVGGQGYAYSEAYPDDKSRAQLKSSVEQAPAFGIIYGETKNLPSPAGYMVYRTVTFLSIIASVWGLMTVIRLLRGQEEDGRWEIIASGNTTSKGASLHILLGFSLALLLAFVICFAATTAYGTIPAINAPPSAGLFISLAIFAPATLFSGLGFLVSQLSVTKRRALFYGLIPLLILFAVRTIGNTTSDWHWLKMFTPFGWTELASPVIDPNMAWLLPSFILAPILVISGMYFIARRDLGAGILHESSTAKPHYFLLGSATWLALRQNSVLFISWGIGALFLSGIMAIISGIAASAVSDSETLKNAVSQIGGGSHDMAVAFIGAGLVLIVIALLLMVTANMANLRSSEAKNQLDNILVQPVRRSKWLVGRLIIILAAALAIALICALATWAMAHAQGIALDLGTLLLVNTALIGTVVFTLGFGALLYGLVPRLAVLGMYTVIAWSFLIDMVGSVVKFDDIIVKSSLLHYVSLSPTENPDWSTFTCLVTLGLIMAALGVVAFTKRDIISE
jgi:ABC-2 type transport system permease protein